VLPLSEVDRYLQGIAPRVSRWAAQAGSIYKEGGAGLWGALRHSEVEWRCGVPL